MQNQTADIEWRAGDVPVSTRFDDPYFSLDDGVAETHHVFLAGNDLPGRFRDGFRIAELGFGTGLNALVTAQAWQSAETDGYLHFTSFEAFPMEKDDMARALSAVAGLNVDALLQVWLPEGGVFELGPHVTLEVIIGDVRDTLKDWDGAADAWYLDGFSPAKNPELWSETVLEQVGAHTAPLGTCATYTAAGFVRRGLAAAGFDINRTPGFGRKRHMTRGVLRA